MAILNNSNAISAGGYDINNSLRFRSSASAYLSRTPASNGDRQKWTFSAWVKRGASGVRQGIFVANPSGAVYWGLEFETGNNLNIYDSNAGGTTALTTTALYRDFGAWYHVVVAVDTTQATAANRCKIYVNGDQVTSFVTTNYPSQNSNTQVNTGSLAHYIGNWNPSVANLPLDGYMAEVNFIDGSQKAASDFGAIDATTGVWKPKPYSGTYGTNGFYLKFSDIATTSGSNAGLGKDFSGNTNYWTTNNISVTSGTTYDAMKDSPTNTSATVANYPTLNPLSNGGATISNANLTTTANGSTHFITNATFQIPTSGKYYFEVTATTLGSTARNGVGLLPNGTALSGYPWGNANAYGWYFGDSSNNIYWNSNTTQPFFISGAVNDVLQICYDADNGTVYAGKNNVFYNSSGATTGSPSTLTNPTSTGATATNNYFPATSVFAAGAFAINFGQRPFSYTPPTGFVALNTYNL
jgi:Concanavalin A-like lectin/glucanases superfamily